MRKELNLLKKDNKEIRRENDNMKKALHKGNGHEQPANDIDEEAMTSEETSNPFETEEENSNWTAEVAESLSMANNDGEMPDIAEISKRRAQFPRSQGRISPRKQSVLRK